MESFIEITLRLVGGGTGASSPAAAEERSALGRLVGILGGTIEEGGAADGSTVLEVRLPARTGSKECPESATMEADRVPSARKSP